MPLTQNGSKGSGNQVCAAMSAKSPSTALPETSYLLLKIRQLQSLKVPPAHHQYCYICSIMNYLLQIFMPNHAKCFVKYAVCSSYAVSGTISYQYFSARLREKSKYCVENIFILLRNNAWAVVSMERTASFVLSNLHAQLQITIIILN